MSADAVLWLPWVAVAIASALAGWLSLRAGRRGDGVGALRWAGWALVPPALLLTGTVRLVGRVTAAVTSWGAGLVLSPLTWLGVVIGAGAVTMIVGAAALRRRRAPDPVTTRRRRVDSGPASSSRPVDDEMAEIEAILKRRGIG